MFDYYQLQEARLLTMRVEYMHTHRDTYSEAIIEKDIEKVKQDLETQEKDLLKPAAPCCVSQDPAIQPDLKEVVKRGDRRSAHQPDLEYGVPWGEDRQLASALHREGSWPARRVAAGHRCRGPAVVQGGRRVRTQTGRCGSTAYRRWEVGFPR